MGIWAITIWATAAMATKGGGTPCERLQTEFAELLRTPPKACAEASETHRKFDLAQHLMLEECRKLEARVNAGIPKLKQGTDEEMRREAMDLRQRDISEQIALNDKVKRELLHTPLDTDDPGLPPAEVDSDCGTEIEKFVSVRGHALTAIADFYANIDSFNDALLSQAIERGSRPTPVPMKPGR